MGEDDIGAALACASKLLDAWRLQGVPLPAWLTRHYRRMQALAARGKETCSAPPKLENESALNCQAVAAMCSASPRWVRANADKLGGSKPGGRDWVFDRCAVLEHLEGQQQ